MNEKIARAEALNFMDRYRIKQRLACRKYVVELQATILCP